MINHIRHSKNKAIKNHTCELCNIDIKKGSVYNTNVMRYDNEIYNFKSHIRCDEISEKLKMHDRCDNGVDSEFFQDDINEKYKDIVQSVDIFIISFKSRLDAVCDEFLNNNNENI